MRVKELTRLLPTATTLLMTHSSTILNPPPIPNTRPFLARFITYRRRRVQLPRPPHPAPRATMSTTSESTTLDDIFKQKKALRTKVRRELKSMDSNLRSQEGDIFGCLNVVFGISCYWLFYIFILVSFCLFQFQMMLYRILCWKLRGSDLVRDCVLT